MATTSNYGIQLSTMGTDVDRTIQMNTGQASTAHHDAGLALGNQWDADIAASQPPPPPPPPTGKTIMGSSGGSWGVAQMLPILNPHIVRAFNPADAAAVPKGVHIAYSNDSNRPAEYALAAGTSSVAALTQEWSTAFKDDSVDQYLILLHEEDIHGPVAQWVQVYKAARKIVDGLNTNRAHKIYLTSTTTGMPFNTTAYKSWFTPEVDVIGVDNYARQHWTTVDAWAKSLNKPWAVPENGIQAQTNPTKYTDDQQLAALQQDYASFNGKALWVTYWPGGGNDLRNKPKTVAQLKSYIAASGV